MNSMYQRPNKPLFLEVKEREPVKMLCTLPAIKAIPMVDRQTECHVTPEHVCQRLVEYSEPKAGDTFADTSCGTGNILNEIINYGVSENFIYGVERNTQLFEYTNERFGNHALNLVNSCFLEYVKSSAVKVDKIIINPPFKKCFEHFIASINFLAEKGILIAVVPISFDYEGAVELEELPDDTFSTTKVRTKVIGFYK